MQILLFASLLMILAQTPATVRTVPAVDLDRSAGDWFEVARYPNRFQRECERAGAAAKASGFDTSRLVAPGALRTVGW